MKYNKDAHKHKFIRWARIDSCLAVQIFGVPYTSGCALCGVRLTPESGRLHIGAGISWDKPLYVCAKCGDVIGWNKKGGGK